MNVETRFCSGGWCSNGTEKHLFLLAECANTAWMSAMSAHDHIKRESWLLITVATFSMLCACVSAKSVFFFLLLFFIIHMIFVFFIIIFLFCQHFHFQLFWHMLKEHQFFCSIFSQTNKTHYTISTLMQMIAHIVGKDCF